MLAVAERILCSLSRLSKPLRTSGDGQQGISAMRVQLCAAPTRQQGRAVRSTASGTGLWVWAPASNMTSLVSMNKLIIFSMSKKKGVIIIHTLQGCCKELITKCLAPSTEHIEVTTNIRQHLLLQRRKRGSRSHGRLVAAPVLKGQNYWLLVLFLALPSSLELPALTTIAPQILSGRR